LLGITPIFLLAIIQFFLLKQEKRVFFFIIRHKARAFFKTEEFCFVFKKGAMLFFLAFH
jgi:hypothetical protein